MRTIRIRSVIATAIILALPLSASAVPITGGIGFGGTYTATGGTGLADATGLDFGSVFTLDGNGDFATIANFTSVAFTDFNFNPSNTPVQPLWDFSFDNIDYSFNLEAVNIDLQDANKLNLSGTGTLMATGFNNTAGTWLFSGNADGQIAFTFSSITATVPEPASMLLIGLGLIGIAIARRKRDASA